MKKRNLFICISAVILAGALIAGIIIGTSVNKRKKTTVVGFYDLPEEYVEAIKETIIGNTQGNYKFIELTEKDLESPKLSKKIDMFAGFNDANTWALKDKSIPLSNGIKERIPSTFKNSRYYTNKDGDMVILPIAVDVFETAMLRTPITLHKIPQPKTIDDYGNFAHTALNYYAVPFIIAGEKDINVNSLISLFVQSYGGRDGYNNVVNKLSNITDFSTINDIEIGGDAADDITIGTIISILKDWQNKNYLPGEWKILTEEQTCNFIEDNRTTVCFMNLSEHRNKPSPNIEYYNVVDFPIETAKKNVSIQPVVVMLSLNNTEATRIALNRLTTTEAQTFISLKTRLGPAMLKGVSCDIQADDARYFATSTEGGAVPDIGTAAFKTKEQRHKLAEAIRNNF